ncbi:MAG: hypothetical protein COV47_05145 [Candidatus Diapherotrites archaeon CG11_big_fil_rev_8_21_14_0_20_37_9]|nr:MAG: hypothetical protein COV47_05145 [Candidatus Diapherotrites archaeon CG11_big_fil_rev_8_21_14_0_20_37_9]
MTTKNTILLIVKQTPGIDYNSLLNKFSSSYSNINSARAALSRSLKDLTTFGFLGRKGNRYFLLDKGESEIFSELKNKLVIGLNDSLIQKNPVNDVDNIVQRLQIIIERSRQDKSLLKTSKTSIGFSISDLDDVNETLSKKIKHLNYISKVFGDQIESLKELDFNDSFSLAFSSTSSKFIASIFAGTGDEEFPVETQSAFFQKVFSGELGLKSKSNSFSVPKESLELFAASISKNSISAGNYIVTLFSSVFKAQFFGSRVIVSGPYSALSKWKKQLI